ncbi:type I restriction-modification system specificity subunit S (plasmid) [Lactococcus lactis subsp. lactis bv. diacetylactis]|nr:restriction endonuclease subunit S [Lactococcus lactis]ARR88277.1 type I restriction-modification system specificity subunit S [Lactococcus lactis subsp. lactis bv. diacetylactis]
MAKIDDSVKKKVPELRFPGFTDDWEERKLGELTTSFSGGTPSAGNSSYYKGDIPFIRSGEINSDKTELFLTEAGLKSSSAKMVSVGDILYALYGATSGEVGISQINGAINQAILAIKPCDGYNSHFLMQWLKLKKQKIIDQYLQGGQGNLSGSIVKNLVLKVPNFEEQKKIGAFFKQLDDTITLHQRKLDLLKEQKKGYLQKMFPKNGAKVPELRFAGFADDWELRKLGDVVGEIQSGNRLPKDSLTNGDVPYVVAQTKNDGVFTKIARGTLDYNGKPMKLFPGNSISFSIDNPEAMFYRNAEFYTSNIMRVIHEDHLTHEQYVFILENMKRFIRGYDWSRKFSGPVVSNLEYLQPSEEEQQKIGSFFKQLDDTIDLHQRKLDLLKEQKKGYLQKMFV